MWNFLSLNKKKIIVLGIVFFPMIASASLNNAIKVVVTHGAQNIQRNIVLPARIPASCVMRASERYDVPPMAILSVLKQESGGRTGIISKNKNGSKDYGPAQFNDRSWGKYMQEKYGISLAALTNNMCQAIMAQAYALRYEWNRCISKSRPTVWCAIAHYHSPTPKYQSIYIRGVWKKHQEILARGKF